MQVDGPEAKTSLASRSVRSCLYLFALIHGMLLPTKNSFLLYFASLKLSLIYFLSLKPHRLKYTYYVI
jgi:hypothetical protein